MKKKLPTILLLVILLVGLSLLLYPNVSDWWNSFHQSRAIASYSGEVAALDEEDYRAMLEAARAYNDRLSGASARYMGFSDEENAQYESLLNVSGTGIMGYIEIPKIHCSLPIYHGTSDSVLQVAVGHLEGTSLPVGGEGTHCVLSGHRGLPSARLFTDLDQLQEGDTFLLYVLDETLTYEVDQIRIVLPEEVDGLRIEAGKDFCTLVTCTPYGINTHRLLVRGRRIENARTSNVRVTADAVQVEPILVAPVVAAPLLLLLLLILLFRSRKKKTP